MKEGNRSSKLIQVGQFCFYLGLLIELLIVIIDKSNYINPIEGQLFKSLFYTVFV